MIGLLARKVGMTNVFDETGSQVPVTVIRVDPNVVIAIKTNETDGYDSIVVGLDEYLKKSVKTKEKTKLHKNRITKAHYGQFPENITPKKKLKELRDFNKDYEAAKGKKAAVGDSLGVETLEGVRYIDVSGVSKGKGFQGVVKRYGFQGGRKTHGSKFHREPGSTGQNTYPARTFKNKKLPGRMGRDRVTVLNLKVVMMDTEKQLILVKGAVPGNNKGLLLVRPAVKRGR